MASELKVDKFTGVTTAGSILVTGEGNSTTTNLQQGLAKVWVCVEQASSYSTRDSFNLSSHGDEGTGKSRLTFTNSFGNANHSASGMASNLNNLVGNDNSTTSHECIASLISIVAENFLFFITSKKILSNSGSSFKG